jgi:phosphomannomutase/phosphoglucomutase
MLNESVFREADIRGRVSAEELNPDSVNLIGKAYGSFLDHHGIPTALVGYDSREHSTELAEAFIDGLLSTGRQVTDLGMVLTPMVYWAQFHFESLGAAMITGSHNPPEWSGFKLAKGYVYTIVTDEIAEIKRMVRERDFVEAQGSLQKEDVGERYLSDCVARSPVGRGFKLVCDCGNATPGWYAPEMLRRAGSEVVELFCDLDPAFPNHFPDPAVVEAREALSREVKRTAADLGVCFDGDGDRLGVVDDTGETVWLDRVGMLWARALLRKHPDATVVADVKCSNMLRDDVTGAGGKFVFSRTGHPFIKQTMKAHNAALGVEFSGHPFFGEQSDYYGYDDALFGAVKLLQALAAADMRLSSFVRDLPPMVSTPEIRIGCPDERKYEVARDVARRMIEDGYEVETIDGARVTFEHGWGLLRASSNMPMVQVRAEADTEEELERQKQVFRRYLAAYDYVSDTWANE